MPHLEREGEVLILDLGEDENRFTPHWIASVNGLLDEIDVERPAALVTAATGKFYSNGLDLDWMDRNPDRRTEFIDTVHALLARVLTLPVVTVAAIQGHCIAAAAMFSMAHDLRIMRADRGFWCVNEVDLGLVFTPGMTALLQARLPRQVAHLAMTTGRRYGGTECVTAGIVDAVAPSADEVRAVAVQQARALTEKSGDALGKIKHRIYGPVIEQLQLGAWPADKPSPPVLTASP